VIGAEAGSAFGPVGAVIGAVIGAGIAWWAGDQLGNLIFAKPGNESKPKDAPPGTKPVDQTGLGSGDVHDVKDQIGARPRDWVGIDPNGNVWTSDPNGNGINHGPVDDYTKRPTGLCK
jgi:hypothetical protein